VSFGAMIRERRQQQGWTQRQLAEAIGCTDGYVAHIENEVKLPSVEIAVALGRALQLTFEDQQRLLDLVETAQRQRVDQRIRTRGAVARGALRTRGGTRPPVQGSDADDVDAERIVSDLSADPDLRVAYQHLKTALANPRMRDTVLNALRAFAREGDAG